MFTHEELIIAQRVKGTTLASSGEALTMLLAQAVRAGMTAGEFRGRMRAEGLAVDGSSLCTRTPGCRLADGHADGCVLFDDVRAAVAAERKTCVDAVQVLADAADVGSQEHHALKVAVADILARK